MLEVRNMSKSYRGKTVVEPVSFRLAEGKCLGILGENGAGKSTLLRCIAQIERPGTGDILFHGKSVLGDRRFLRRHVGYVPQEEALAPGISVRDQLKLWQSACGGKGKLPEGLIDLLGLESLLPVQTDHLSGGQKRRVSIAMALLPAPDILILDEITNGLDKEYSPRLLDWMEAFLAHGGRALWCSHKGEELERLCTSRLTL